MKVQIRPESLDTDLEGADVVRGMSSPSRSPSRCSMNMKQMSWVEKHIIDTLSSLKSAPAAFSAYIVFDNIRLFLYHLDLSSYWPRRAAPAATPASWCLTYVALLACLAMLVVEIRDWFSPGDAPLAVDTGVIYDDITTYIAPIAVTLSRKYSEQGSEWESLFDNASDALGGERIFKVFSRQICHGYFKDCDSYKGRGRTVEVPLKECSDPKLFESFSYLGDGAEKVKCIDFQQILGPRNARPAVNNQSGLLGEGDRFPGPMLRGTYGSPDYRFLEIRLEGNWLSSVQEEININVYAALLGDDPFLYLDESNGRPRVEDPEMIQDGHFEGGARTWGRLFYMQLTPGMRNNVEVFFQPIHFTYSERCTFAWKGKCNVKEGSFATGEFPPQTQHSATFVYNGKMLSAYIRLKSAFSVRDMVRINKTFLDVASAVGGTIGLIFVFFTFFARDMVNGIIHKVRRFKRRLHETHMTDAELQLQNRVHDVVDTMPIDEVLRFLLEQSYKHRKALIGKGLVPATPSNHSHKPVCFSSLMPSSDN